MEKVESYELDEPSEKVVDSLDAQTVADDEVDSAVPEAELATSPSSRTAHDELPFEPVFSPLDCWQDDADAYDSAGYVNYDDDWDEAADTTAAAAKEPTLAESLAREVLARIEKAKQLADEAAAVTAGSPVAAAGSPVATGGSPVASPDFASAGEPPAPRAPTGPCPQCLVKLVDLRDEPLVAPVVDETEVDVVDDALDEAESVEYEESTPEQVVWLDGDEKETESETVDDTADLVDSQLQSPTGVASHSPPAVFEWEDLFPEVSLNEKEIALKPAAPDEGIASTSRLTEPLAPPVVDSPEWPETEAEPSDESTEPPVESSAERSTQYSVLSTDIESEGLESEPDLEPATEAAEQSTVLSDKTEAVPRESDELPVETSIGEEPVVEEEPTSAPSTESSALNTDVELDVEPSDEPSDELSEPPVESPAELSTQYAVLSAEVEAEQLESEPDAESATDSPELPSNSSDEVGEGPRESEPGVEVESHELDSASKPEEIAPAIDIPAASGAERAAWADLGDPLLAKQFTELGQRVMSDLGVTTHPSAALAGAEHQPHVTDVALRTALSLALAGRQVLLVDAALADKHLTSGLGLSAEFGLSETLKGRIPWQQAVRATATPGLCVLPAGRITPPTLASGDKRLASLLKELSSQWELVLLDTGSCHDSTAAPVIKSARNVYLLFRLGETQTEAAAAAIATIEKTGAKLRGAVATNA